MSFDTPSHRDDLQRELERLRNENALLRRREADLLAYLRQKIDNMLNVMGTFPLRSDELDDEHMIAFDPIGIITDTFAHILENLRVTNSQLELARDEIAAIFNVVNAGILVLDADSRIVSCNRRIVELFHPDGEVVGEYCSSLLCHNQVDRDNCIFLKVMASGMREQTFGWKFDGSCFDVFGAPVKNHAGEVVQVVTVYLDVTARWRVERELQAALQRVDAIVQSIAEGLLVLDASGRVVKANHAAESIAARPLSQLVGRPIGEIFPDTTLINAVDRALQSGCESPPLFDLSLHGDDPRQAQCFEVRIAPLLKDGGEAHGLVLSLHDVTRERMIERMKSEFVSTAAHELRTPLATIIGYSELLLDPEFFSPHQRQEFMQLIHSKAGDLSDLIDDLLDISRIESGQEIMLDRRVVSLDALAEKSIDFYERGSKQHQFRLVRAEEPLMVEGDPLRCGQIFDNLLSNAVKYSPAGGTITVTLGEQNGRAVVSIRDEGIGMTPEQVAHVFDKFYRADSSNTAISGTGLGMTIVQDLVTAHGGEIRVKSEVDCGTEVIFTLPRAAATAVVAS